MPQEIAAPAFAWGARPASDLVAGLLGDVVDIRHACLACGASGHGRPYMRGGPDLSIAHCGELTIVAIVDGGRIGVDVEAADAVVPAHIRHPDDPPADVDLWVRKEAYVKATGEGLRRDLRTIAPHQPGVRWGSLDVGPDYRAAYCWISPDASV